MQSLQISVYGFASEKQKNSWFAKHGCLTLPYTNQLLSVKNISQQSGCMQDGIYVPVPTLFTHVLRLCGTNLLRVAVSSFPSFDINIWANAVRQLLGKNPQQSLAVTTWECSSEGYALHCD